ncbi:MAG TPA: GGDEF domain-containing protein [Burkholderiales bacterium]|nr:GGDEF domain-containing protein [Burkholderiales bacterium]
MLADQLKKASASPHAPVVAFCIAVPVFLFIVFAEHVTSYELGFGAFYLLVILAVGWFCGLPWATLFAFLAMFAQVEVGRTAAEAASTDAVSFYLVNANRLFAYLLVAWLISILRAMYHRENEMARVDYLTGIPNKLGFDEQLKVEIARHRRDRNPFAVAYIDCDNFKSVNDTRGHSAGDRLLKTIAETSRRNLRATDTIARLGGDEFAVILPATGEFAALQAINKLRKLLDAAIEKNHRQVTLSIGVGVFLDTPESSDRVVSFSDNVMYQVKSAGKNRVLHRTYVSDTGVDVHGVRAEPQRAVH